MANRTDLTGKRILVTGGTTGIGRETVRLLTERSARVPTCARQAIVRMERGGGGHLVFVGSISTAIKARGESVYAATKAGIQAFAETLRKEISDKNIKVSVIQPGSVDTDMQECSDDEKRKA